MLVQYLQGECFVCGIALHVDVGSVPHPPVCAKERVRLGFGIVIVSIGPRYQKLKAENFGVRIFLLGCEQSVNVS